ncbi:ANL_collapsed_G0042130.mRNA.1.CDS.1 [Saccharomyces cerevisiae]|nr:ANL_collapsed_G0042130.mRNA.1.CDS.1 [Saccharomyces cerevisiae]
MFLAKLMRVKEARFLRKDLRILIKSLEINKDIESGKRKLLQHLLLAQEEILSKSPELKEFFENRKKKLSMVKDINRDPNDDFKTFVTYCLSSKDIAAALSCKITSVEWMVMADMPPGQILLSQANLGSLFYLQAEKLEADLNQLEQKKSKESNQRVRYGNIHKAVRFVHKIVTYVWKEHKNVTTALLRFAKRNRKIRFHVKDQLDPSIALSIALSTYGMGVLSLHEGVLAKAEKLFKDSITMAKETEFNELLAEAEKELEKTTVLKAPKKRV